MICLKMGWKPFKESYMEHNLPKNLNKEQLEIINELFDWLVDPCIDFIRNNCKFQIQTSFIHLTFSLMKLYTCMLDEIAAIGTPEATSQELSPQVVS